jgi:predicted lactoylglutathione lyase
MIGKFLFFAIITLICFSCKQSNKNNQTTIIMESRFTVLTLGVEDLEKSFRFYHNGLGLPSQGIIGKEFEHGEVAFFDLPHGMKLALWSRENLAWDSKVAKQDSAATEFSIGYTVRNKEEVDTIMALAKKAGAKITKPAQKAFWGGYSGYFQDPDGHLWEIAWNPQLLPED